MVSNYDISLIKFVSSILI